MTRDDVPQFTAWLTQLAEYFPQSKVNLPVVLEGYFSHLQALDIVAIQDLFAHVLQRCTFFPTIAELLTIAGTEDPALNCRFCPEGHGRHTGHSISHYPAGPRCGTCNANMPTPRHYSYTLPERTPSPSLALPSPAPFPDPEADQEYRRMMAEAYAIARVNQEAKEREEERRRVERKEFLRAQARMLLDKKDDTV